jgi:hypothetical protein
MWKLIAPMSHALVLILIFLAIAVAGDTQQSGNVPAKPQLTAKPTWGKPIEAPPAPLPKKPLSRLRYDPPPDPMEMFHQDLQEAVLREVGPTFPDLRAALADSNKTGNARPHQRIIFQLLEAATEASAEKRPAILLAAELLAEHPWFDYDAARSEPKGDKQLQNELARYGLTLSGGELGGVSYQRDLLWRLWRDYPGTDWGERAFVLLLESGWDPAVGCGNGANQFYEVIRRGEAFLRDRPGTLYREPVTFLVAEADVTWWALSNDVDFAVEFLKEYQNGAEEARVKAIRYFEQLLQSDRNTQFANYARRVAPHLQQKHVPNIYRFFCIYD